MEAEQAKPQTTTMEVEPTKQETTTEAEPTKQPTTTVEAEQKHNPWSVQHLEDFLFFCCPECPDRSSTKKTFINHALHEHPQVKFLN